MANAMKGMQVDQIAKTMAQFEKSFEDMDVRSGAYVYSMMVCMQCVSMMNIEYDIIICVYIMHSVCNRTEYSSERTYIYGLCAECYYITRLLYISVSVYFIYYSAHTDIDISDRLIIIRIVVQGIWSLRWTLVLV